MKRSWLLGCVGVVVAVWLAEPAAAQKGKGGGKGGGRSFTPPGKSGGKSGGFQPSGPGKSQPARPFDHPKSGNSLPQEVKDQLPPGLRDKPENHPGLANHLRKMGYEPTTTAEPPLLDSQTSPPSTTPASAAPSTAPSAPAPSAPAPSALAPSALAPAEATEVITPTRLVAPTAATTPGGTVPVQATPQPTPPSSLTSLPEHVRKQLPPRLRDRPITDPAVANYLGRMGWTIAEDGTLVPPPAPAGPRPFFRRR